MCNACHLRWRSQEKKKIQALASPIPEKNQTPTEKIQKPKKIKTVESSSKPPQTKKPENEPTIKIIPGQLYCHTCFKTETPVWRGGPDGYRTQVFLKINKNDEGQLSSLIDYVMPVGYNGLKSLERNPKQNHQYNYQHRYHYYPP